MRSNKMFKYIALTFALISVCWCSEARKHKVEDPFTALDRHITHTLAYHYLWPWSQLVRAAAALDAEESLEEPQIQTDDKVYRINLSAKRFKPDELKVKVKNGYILVEGKHKVGDAIKFLANHFVQRFAMPPGSKQEEVTAVLKENGVLTISVPKHELPAPLPEREVPIEVILPQNKDKPEMSSEKIETSSEKTVEASSEKTVEVSSQKNVVASSEKTIEVSSEKNIAVSSSSAAPLDQLDLTEATTHVGKIRKKELKTTTKTIKDNEVTKGVENNGLDYALIESEFE